LSTSKGDPFGTSSSSAPRSASAVVVAIEPDVFADRQADAMSRNVTGSGSGPGEKTRFFVEDAVVGELVLETQIDPASATNATALCRRPLSTHGNVTTSAGPPLRLSSAS
jgi:hypothetical protein